jgi:hypothetical protein
MQHCPSQVTASIKRKRYKFVSQYPGGGYKMVMGREGLGEIPNCLRVLLSDKKRTVLLPRDLSHRDKGILLLSLAA